MLRLTGAARSALVRDFEAALGSSTTFDERYQRFEEFVRHGFAGEPRPSVPPTRFYPKLRPLREAMLAFEVHMQQHRPSWSFFVDLLPLVLSAACDDSAPASSPEADLVEVPRAHVAAWLSNALLLNAPRGSALDLLGGGVDPLFVSGGKIAVQKILCLLCYLSQALPSSSDGGVVVCERASSAAVEPVGGPSSHDGDGRPLHEALELEQAAPQQTTEASREEKPAAAAAMVMFSSRSFGGGAVAGNSATQEEILLMIYPEALPALVLFGGRPTADDEAVLVHGVRRHSETSGYAHTLRWLRPCAATAAARGGDDEGVGEPAAAAATTTTLVAIDAARQPGVAQFLPGNVHREVAKATIGLAALQRRHAAAASRAPGAAAAAALPAVVECDGLWGCEGFSGGQPVLRLLLLLLGAAHARVTVRLTPPAGDAQLLKWLSGVMAEVRAARPPAAALQAVLCAESLQRRERMAGDVPAFSSFVIKSLRAAQGHGQGHGQGLPPPRDDALAAAVQDGISHALPQRHRRHSGADEASSAVPAKRLRTEALCTEET